MRTNVEILLGDWGRWKAIQDDAGLGYPSEAAFSKMRVDCNVYAGANIPMADPDVFQVNVVIGTLAPFYQKVIRVQYTVPGSWKKKPEVAGMLKTAYFEALKAAHIQVAHHMGGKYARDYIECVPERIIVEGCSGTI